MNKMTHHKCQKDEVFRMLNGEFLNLHFDLL